MDQAAAQVTQDTSLSLIPNTYEVRNRSIAVSFSSTSITGKPLMRYKDREREVNAIGDEIRQVETEIGTMVTITLEPDADAGSLLFTLVVPRAVVQSINSSVRISTVGIITRSRLPPRLPTNTQRQTYAVERLTGTASIVVS